MSDTVIKVENLSKRYLVGHRAAARERYATLRDTITREARNFGRKALDLARGRQIVQGDEIEEYWALKDVSFAVKRGEVVGIIGRNGAGKSTLLKILSRITEPTEGRVELRGRVASLLEVGTGFHPELTGRENIFLNGAILGMTQREIRRKFDEIVAFADVERFLDTPVKRYSSGMYVRLAFAVAAHLEPEILIVDEVLAVGDAEFQKKCLGKMKDVAGQGRTVLFVSHNMSAISNLCHSGITLDKGTVGFRGAAGGAVKALLENVPLTHSVHFAPNKNAVSITGIAIRNLMPGDDRITIDIEFYSPFPLCPPAPGIVITTMLGIPVFGSNARRHPCNFLDERATTGTLTVTIDSLPIWSDTYQLSVSLGDWRKDYDKKENALAFQYWPNQKDHRVPPVSTIGPIDWEARWHMEVRSLAIRSIA